MILNDYNVRTFRTSLFPCSRRLWRCTSLHASGCIKAGFRERRISQPRG